MSARAILLPSNRPADRFYRGGSRIAALRGEPGAGPAEPEDWIASVTAVAGEAEKGRTRLPGGRLLADEIAEDPELWLGAAHVGRYGADPLLLVKLLDAGQRLPVHAHPDTVFALAALGHAHGKAEAWYVLEGGTVHLGLREEVTSERLAALVAQQRTGELLALLHEIPVAPGDVVFVPPGMLHAIGEGVFVLEVQEPEDLSILLEWEGFALDGAADGHLGLGFDRALCAVDTSALTPQARDGLISRSGSACLLPPQADPFFRLERHRVLDDVLLEQGFAVAVVTEGAVTAEETGVGPVRWNRGATALIPHGAGRIRLSGVGEVVVARPPLIG